MLTENPFNPTFGDIPELFLQAETSPHEIASLIEQSKFARSFFITGVRGSGKTVYMTKVASLLSTEQNFVHIDLLNNENIIENFSSKLYYASNSKFDQILPTIESLSVAGLSFKFSDNQSDNPELLIEELLNVLKSQSKKVLITIDEVDDSKAIQRFAQLFAALKRKQLPVFCLMTGLPELVLNVQNNKKLTFLLRSEKIFMSPLDNLAMVQTYQKVFACSVKLASQMAKLTAGYSYAFQLLGYLCFENNPQLEETNFATVKELFQLTLFENAYQKIFEGLSDLDRQYLIAIQGQRKLEEVCRIMNKDKVFVSQYRRRALERRLIRPTGHGTVDYTLPLFSEYINAVQDPDSLFYLGY